jgi:hypothetical protein
MNRALLSLSLCGAAVATANALILHRPTCPAAGTSVTAAYKDAPQAKAGVDGTATATAKPLAAVNTGPAKPPEASAQTKRPQIPIASVKRATPVSEAADVTGSVKQTAKTQEPATVSQEQAQLAELIDRTGQVKQVEEWAEVLLAAKSHKAASVSAPILRYYRVGTRLKVVGRGSGWIKIVDPITSETGWIYEKYLKVREGRDDDSAKAGSDTSAAANVKAPPEVRPHANLHRSRKYGWRWYRSRRHALGFGISVYPRW